MSQAALHLRSPITSSADATPHSSFNHFNADALNPSASAARVRSRPRFAKLRKQFASQHARSRTRTGDESSGSGFNPFSSDQVSGNVSGVESGTGACDGGSSNGHRRFENEVFVFGARKDDSDPARDLDSDLRYRKGTNEKETEFRKSGGVEFVFSAKPSDVESNSLPEKEGESSEGGANSVSGDERKMRSNSEGEQREFNSTGFVFSAGRDDSVYSLNKEKEKSSAPVGNSGFDHGRERECKTEFECEKRDCFGGNRSGRASGLGSAQNSDHGMGAFNVNTETNSNGDTGADQYDHLGDDDKCKSQYGSTNGVSAADSDIPACNLPDEMKKLNINHFEGVDITRDSTNSDINTSPGFVFGGSDKAFGKSSVSSGTDADGQQPSTHAAFENISRQYVKAGKINDVQNGTACGIAHGSSGISFSKPSSSQEGTRDFQCGKIPECNVSEDSQVNGATAPFSFSSSGLDFISNYYDSMGHSSNDGHHGKGDNCFASTPEASKVSFMDFKPPTWDPSCFKDNLFPKLNTKFESTQKGRSCKEKGSKCTRRKLKPQSINKKQTRLDHLSKENGSLKTPDSSGCHSPMDFSPYQETAANDQDVKASEVLNGLHSTTPADYKDEHLPAVGREGINTTGQRCGDPDNTKSCNGSSSVDDFHSSGPEVLWRNLKTEQFCNSNVDGASADAGVDFTSNNERKKDDIFRFVHGLSDSKGKDFAFSASSTVEGPSSFKRKQRKKFRRKTACNSFVISPDVNGKFSSVPFSPLTAANMSSHSDVMDKSQINDRFKEGDVASSDTIPADCDKWRLRGNQAHKDGDLSKAEDFYTLGINSVLSSEKSGCWVKPLLLCYSNRAATRMSLGRIREALEDCLMATALDPNFLKVQMRTANCHLLLGEAENAQQCFNKCLDSGSVVCLDRRVMLEAAEGLRKAQEVIKCINNAAELLKERTSDAAVSASELVTKGLSISLYSEKLLQMKAEALCLMQKYDAAIQLCEQSQNLAEKNFALGNNADNFNGSICDSYSSVKLWRWSLISKCYFHLGRLEASLNVLERLQHIVSVTEKCVIDNAEDLSLAATIRELLDHKSAGNENFKLGKYTEAVENYTAALSCNIKSRPFAAICFCNRAAANQALGQIADAIADCSMAIALDGNYAKAISRRATLHEMVRDYEQAACDLKRLLAVLETQSNEKAKLSGSPSGSNGGKESRQAHQRLHSVEDQAKKGTPLDFYLILGIKTADTATDVKKAYHKAALRHHPDKAGQLFARSEVADEGRVWKEITKEVYKDADRLFKMIGEAYAVLSDPAKRSEYDLEEEIRKASKQQSNRGGSGRRSSDVYGFGKPSDGYKSPSDRTSNRRYGRDHWKTYGHSYSRW